jgi:iron complex outermembrane receptor protein
VEALDPAPKEVDSWELGVRGQWDRARFALSGYLSESDLGSTFGPDLRIQRAPEEIRGLEADVEATPVDRWTFGGTLTLVEGERDADDDGEVDDPLNSIRIPPTKVTGHVENATLPGWRNRLQLIHSGSRNEFPGSATFGEGAVESYTVVDFTSALDLWQGTVTLSVENLFDEFYFPVASQATNLGSAFSAGQGRRLSLEYRVDW